MRPVYNVLLSLLAPLWLPWVWLKARRRSEQPNWKERFGNFNIPPKGHKRRIWFHTVSVGEFVAAKPILKEVKRLLPDHEIILTVTTSSGHKTAREAEQGLFDYIFYFPLDLATFQQKAMKSVAPDVVAVMETELWLNLLWAAKNSGAKTLLINGRISDRSFPRAKRMKFFYRALFRFLDQALMQTESDAARIRELGADTVQVLGNCKFDQAADSASADAAEWRAKLGIPDENQVLVIGSTRGEEEEQLVLDALGQLDRTHLSIVHAPRHLERVPELKVLAESALGTVALRSKGESGGYLILDTYGELAAVYSVADLVVIGGGFANLGGQNLIQPLALGKPVIHGPHMQNFKDVSAAADQAGAAIVAANSSELRHAIQSLLDNPDTRAKMGAAATDLVHANLGAGRRYAEAIAAACQS